MFNRESGIKPVPEWKLASHWTRDPESGSMCSPVCIKGQEPPPHDNVIDGYYGRDINGRTQFYYTKEDADAATKEYESRSSLFKLCVDVSQNEAFIITAAIGLCVAAVFLLNSIILGIGVLIS